MRATGLDSIACMAQKCGRQVLACVQARPHSPRPGRCCQSLTPPMLRAGSPGADAARAPARAACTARWLALRRCLTAWARPALSRVPAVPAGPRVQGCPGLPERVCAQRPGGPPAPSAGCPGLAQPCAGRLPGCACSAALQLAAGACTADRSPPVAQLQCRFPATRKADWPVRAQVASYRCIVSHETPKLQDFTLCVLQRNNCLGLHAPIPSRPAPEPMPSFRGQALTHEAAERIFIGWLGAPARVLGLPCGLVQAISAAGRLLGP